MHNCPAAIFTVDLCGLGRPVASISGSYHHCRVQTLCPKLLLFRKWGKNSNSMTLVLWNLLKRLKKEIQGFCPTVALVGKGGGHSKSTVPFILWKTIIAIKLQELITIFRDNQAVYKCTIYALFSLLDFTEHVLFLCIACADVRVPQNTAKILFEWILSKVIWCWSCQPYNRISSIQEGRLSS